MTSRDQPAEMGKGGSPPAAVLTSHEHRAVPKESEAACALNENAGDTCSASVPEQPVTQRLSTTAGDAPVYMVEALRSPRDVLVQRPANESVDSLHASSNQSSVDRSIQPGLLLEHGTSKPRR